MKKAFSFLWLFPVLLLPGCSSFDEIEPVPAVEDFRVSRYMGEWYELARSPNPFENGLTRVTATYSWQSNGKVKIVNRGYSAEKKQYSTVTGSAEMKRKSTTGELKVCFFWPFTAEYRIIALEKDYRHAVVIDGKQEYIWILAREKSLPEAEMNELLDMARGLGFDPDDMIYSWKDEKETVE